MAEPKFDKEQIKKLRQDGLTYNEIAKEVGCSPQYVSLVLETPEQRERRLANKRKWEKVHKDRLTRKRTQKLLTKRIKRVIQQDPTYAKRLLEAMRGAGK